LKQLEVTCDVKERVDYKLIIPFQGNLKIRSDRDIEKLSGSLLEYGISFPFFVWEHESKLGCIDGHGRLEALELLDLTGYEIPPVPIIRILATNETEAKKKLLYENAKYGDMSYDSIMKFTEGMEIDMTEFSLPSGRMIYDDGSRFDPGAFTIEIPKFGNDDEVSVEGSGFGASRPVPKNEMNKFKIGKTVLILNDEEAGLLAYAIKEYLVRNNGLFGFIAELNGSEI